jgi:hypothetical protein
LPPLTHYQQNSNELTAKQASVSAAFDVISPLLAATFDRIAHVAVMRSLALQLTWEGTVLDVGCGQGVFGELLALYHKAGIYTSEAMIKGTADWPVLPLANTRWSHGANSDQLPCTRPYHLYQCFPIRQPMTFMAALSQMFPKVRKPITFDIPEVSTEYARKLNNVPKLWLGFKNSFIGRSKILLLAVRALLGCHPVF